MCVLIVYNVMLENRIISREHRSCSQDSTYRAVRASCSQDSTYRAVRAPGRISKTSSSTVFRVREPSRSVWGEGRSQTCPYETGFVRANPVFALEIQRATRRLPL
jgi:hypothetical protein